MLQVLNVEGCDEESLSKAIDEIKVSPKPLTDLSVHVLHDAALLQSMYSDVPDGIVQEPLDSEMSRNGGWKGKFVFPNKHRF